MAKKIYIGELSRITTVSSLKSPPLLGSAKARLLNRAPARAAMAAEHPLKNPRRDVVMLAPLPSPPRKRRRHEDEAHHRALHFKEHR